MREPDRQYYWYVSDRQRREQRLLWLSKALLPIVVACGMLYIPYASIRISETVEEGMALTEEIRRIHEESRMLLTDAEANRLRDAYFANRQKAEFERDVDFYSEEFPRRQYSLATPEMKAVLRENLPPETLVRVRNWMDDNQLRPETLESYGRRELDRMYRDH